jgi:competence protein ComEC
MEFLIAIVSGFASGVFLRSLFVFGWQPVVFALLLFVLFAGAAFLKPRIVYSLGAAFCLLVVLGMLRASLADTPLPDTFARDLRHRVSYEGVVVADPDMRDANQRIQIRVSNTTESTVMLAVAPRHPKVAVGDLVHVSGTLLTPEAFATEGGRVFRYDKYLQKDDVRFLLNFAYVRVIEEAPWYSLPALLARIKHSFLDGVSLALPEPYASLAGGIVIGGKSGLGNELKEAFTRSGLIHIIVLSGYNVMIVAEWVIAALSLTKLKRRWGAIAGALALLVFVGIAGATATSIRAAIMALIALYARASGRTYAAARALLFVILLMLIWNPLYLVFDPGFGLSVTATAGLIWLAPRIEMLFVFLKNVFWKEVVATTLAAQIAVLPILLYNTGNLSLVAIPANLLVAPLMPLAMSFSALAGFAGILFGSVTPLLGILLAFPAYLTNAYLIFIAQESAALPFAAFTLPLFPFWLVLASYATLIYFTSSKRFSTTPQLRLAKKASI